MKMMNRGILAILEIMKKASCKSGLHFYLPAAGRDAAFCLVPMLQRGNPYGMHSHAGARERESKNRKKCKLLLSIYEGCQKFLFRKKFFPLFLIFTAFINVLCGCSLIPKKLFIEDMTKSFDEGTIISAKTRKPISFAQLIDELSKVQVVYVGETHINPAHHDVQLKIIKELHKKKQLITIGMEMFDYTYDHVLDLWTAGKLDEKEFLQKVHWYANWKFDFGLYSEILYFARANQIKLVGLNIPFHIPPKIAMGGIASLSNEDKKYLPNKIDHFNAAHRNHIKKIFDKYHQGHIKGMKNFDFFYMAQSVCDDTMAESISKNLHKNTMIVLAGNGHIIHKSGLPQKTFFLTNTTYKTLYPASVGSSVQLTCADYIWVTPQVEKYKNTKQIHIR